MVWLLLSLSICSRRRVLSSAHCFLHERGNLCLFGRSQPLHREAGRPHVAFVEVRLVAETERRIPGLELRRCLEEADDFIVLGIRRHTVPESRREARRAFFDDIMEPFGHGAIRFPHLSDLREHGALPLPLASPHLLDAVPYRASFLFRECAAGRAGPLDGLLRALLCGFHGIRFVFSELKYFSRVHCSSLFLRGNLQVWSMRSSFGQEPANLIRRLSISLYVKFHRFSHFPKISIPSDQCVRSFERDARDHNVYAALCPT